jgi:inorganic triphosphatase YgiF
MPQETELKLSLRPQDLPRLLAHPVLRGQAAHIQRLFNTYYDTPSLALMAQRVAVRERRIGRRTLLTVKTAGQSAGGLSQRGEWEGPTRPGQFGFEALVGDTALAQSLSQLAWQLVPVFRTDFVRRSWRIGHAGAQIEVALDRGSITTGDGQGPRGEPLLELELELLDGPVDALLDLAHSLALGPEGDAATGLWLHPSDRSKAERGLALFLGRPPEPVRAGPVRLRSDMTPAQAFRTVALDCLTQLQANAGALLAQPAGPGLPDPEFVHQARVALRRLRSALRLFAPWLPARFVRHWSAVWQARARALDAARDWDVLGTEGLPGWAGDAADAGLRAWVLARRQDALTAARSALSDPAQALDLLAFTRALLALDTAPTTATGDALTAWARRTLRQRHERLQRDARRALQGSAAERHALRLQFKKLRYAQEFLAGLLPARRLQRQAALLTRCQSLLGQLNDLAVARRLLADAPTKEPSVRARLLERLQRQENRCLAKLPALERELLQAPGR